MSLYQEFIGFLKIIAWGIIVIFSAAILQQVLTPTDGSQGEFPFFICLIAVLIAILMLYWTWAMIMLPLYVKALLNETREGHKELIREIRVGNQELKNVSEQQERLLAMINVEFTNEE